ncbi:hypothetical protein CANCADRAFT_3480 [Tortispora caseinolytica NRRL Y-17796]|uniref:non-specific serine/threonine protein kinase n=1 Tax=Tortispora caseinolytica NRRL Y-17796 TaxID=767744 RepID=A0A1E4TB12_9ASCO|nr:hypothetical protein CANCADRAFT_3480 [Tortispora caseinolytica NRRL Y-17796]
MSQTSAAKASMRLGEVIDGRYQLEQVLGVGGYGSVYSAIELVSKSRFAVKILPRKHITQRQLQFQKIEIALHKKVSKHPHIVSLLEVIEKPHEVYMIMEYCPDGDLFTNITERNLFVHDPHAIRRAFIQLIDAVQYCHAQGVYHRDLKPENILYCARTNSLKLTDFGLATPAPETRDFGCGSTFYMSPECLNSFSPNSTEHSPSSLNTNTISALSPPSSKSTSPKHSPKRANDCMIDTAPPFNSAANDVWSLGVIFINLACGRNPWKKASPESDEAYSAFLKNSAFLLSILPLTSSSLAILVRIFEPNPLRRISLPELRRLVIQCPEFTVTPRYLSARTISPRTCRGEYQANQYHQPASRTQQPHKFSLDQYPYEPRTPQKVIATPQGYTPKTPQTPFERNSTAGSVTKPSSTSAKTHHRHSPPSRVTNPYAVSVAPKSNGERDYHQVKAASIKLQQRLMNTQEDVFMQSEAVKLDISPVTIKQAKNMQEKANIDPYKTPPRRSYAHNGIHTPISPAEYSQRVVTRAAEAALQSSINFVPTRPNFGSHMASASTAAGNSWNNMTPSELQGLGILHEAETVHR